MSFPPLENAIAAKASRRNAGHGKRSEEDEEKEEEEEEQEEEEGDEEEGIG